MIKKKGLQICRNILKKQITLLSFNVHPYFPLHRLKFYPKIFFLI